MPDTLSDGPSTLSFEDVFGLVDEDEVARVLEQSPAQTIRTRPRESDLAARHAFERLRELGSDPRSRFHVAEELGSGGMGVVHLAEQRSLSRPVALKQLHEELHEDATAGQTLVREAWVLGALEHPNVVPVHDLMIDPDGRPVVALKRIEGDRWLELIDDPERVEDEHGAEDVLEWHLQVFVSVCNAASFAHSRGLLHRDIKPENVMVGRFGEVYLLDWGIAVSLEDDGTGRMPLARDVETLAGTPWYMAPEMLGGRGAVLGVHTDVYLLGATLYHVLTGSPPHAGESLMAIATEIATKEPEFGDDVPAALADICRKALSRNPEDRYRSVEQLRAEVVDYLRHRDAMLLADEGEARLRELEALREDVGDDPDAHRLAMFNLYSEARLGFRLARRMWPAGEQANAGLVRASVAMVRYLLDRGEVSSADTIARQVEGHLDPDLRERLRRAKEADATQRRRVARLEQLGRELDPTIGRTARMIAYSVIASLFVVSELVGHFVSAFETHLGLIGSTVGSLLVVGAIGVVFRRALLSTELNRRIYLAVVAGFVGELMLHVTVAMLDRPAWEGHALSGVIYAVGAAVVAVFHHPALMVLSAAFGGAALASVAYPDGRAFFYAGAGALMVVALIGIHRHLARKSG